MYIPCINVFFFLNIFFLQWCEDETAGADFDVWCSGSLQVTVEHTWLLKCLAVSKGNQSEQVWLSDVLISNDAIELITLSQWDDFLLLISKWSKSLDPRVPRDTYSHHLTSHYLVMVPICTLLSSNSDERNIPRRLFTCIRGKGPRSCWLPLIRACLNNFSINT